MLSKLKLFPCLRKSYRSYGTYSLAVPLGAITLGGINSGDSAWLMTSFVLVLFMTLPGLALFYSGFVQRRHASSVLLHCIAIASLFKEVNSPIHEGIHVK